MAVAKKSAKRGKKPPAAKKAKVRDLSTKKAVKGGSRNGNLQITQTYYP